MFLKKAVKGWMGLETTPTPHVEDEALCRNSHIDGLLSLQKKVARKTTKVLLLGAYTG